MFSTIKRWSAAVLWVAVIFTAIPFVRSLRNWYADRWDPLLIGWGVAVVLVAAAGFAIAWARRQQFEPRAHSLIWLSAVTAVMVVWTLSLRRSPEETIHFLEYGVLAVLLHRALRPTMPDAWVFVAGALLGSLVGTLDEVIQWISPTRFWDWRDLGLNAGAGALVQLALWRITPISPNAPTTRSLRIVLRLAVAQLVVLGICLANTPKVVARYAPGLPGCEHLLGTENPMAEYGHLHSIPGLGSFKSRLDLAEIDREDRERAEEVAALVDDARTRYGLFLKTWPVSADPFTYEMRVHLFARDRNVGKARERGFEGSLADESMTIAWFENRILEEHFGATLGHSSYQWRDRLRKRVEEAADTTRDFQSAAGSHLITIASEGVIRTILLILIGALIVADLGLGWYGGRR